MDQGQMRHAQRRHQLMGLEPLQLLKRIQEGRLASHAELASLFHEPRMAYVEAAATTREGIFYLFSFIEAPYIKLVKTSKNGEY